MNITVYVRVGMNGVEHIHFVELLCALTAVFQHCTHCGIAVDIRIFAFYIAVCRRCESEVFVDFHQR